MSAVCTKCACALFVPQMWQQSKCADCFHAATAHVVDGTAAARVAPPDALLARSLQRRLPTTSSTSSIASTSSSSQSSSSSLPPLPPLPAKKVRGRPTAPPSSVPSLPPKPSRPVSIALPPPPDSPPGTPPLPESSSSSSPSATMAKPLPAVPSAGAGAAVYGTLYSPFQPLRGSLTTAVLSEFRQSLTLFALSLPPHFRELGRNDSKVLGCELVSTLLAAVGVPAESVDGLLNILLMPLLERVPRVLPPASIDQLRFVAADLRRFAAAQAVVRGVTALQARVRGVRTRRRLARASGRAREPLRRCMAAFGVLLRSERAYVADLQLLVNEYVLPLRGLQLLAASDQERLFVNAEQLLAAHVLLLAELEALAAAWPLPDALGDTLTKAAPSFEKHELVFVRGYARALGALQELRAGNKKLAQWLDATHARIDAQRDFSYGGFESLIAQPINRLNAFVRCLAVFVADYPCGLAIKTSLQTALMLVQTATNNCMAVFDAR